MSAPTRRSLDTVPVDVVISNCVINPSTEKAAVLLEIARVLRSGARVGISDVVAEDQVTEEDQAERGSYAWYFTVMSYWFSQNHAGYV